MSSHHFVKEQQEPALLILNTIGFGYESIAPLLEWSPTVLVAQEEVHTVISWGIKIDLIIADMDFQKENYSLLEEQYPVKFLGVSDENFLDEGLQYLIATKHGSVNVIGFNHQQVFGLEAMLSFLDLVVWDAPMRYFPVKNGAFKKWFAGASLQLHAPEGTFVEVQENEENQIYAITYATFIEVGEGFVTFKSNKVFWIGDFVMDY
ncbi:thiamine pyrophosphokinase [Belliella kenyensis]|uniref:Thiamine pyrophosphokinase n=1 Tax=Belliella kenyensis TaxID=1472724 RepID=A0ABV8EN10_9BACT|nr:thiamine pyrophosphokinase [Belliella kenyensis]MCH7401471.1 thiamine pyrophosphokinase [Belliella kenyensis]MDN3603248.1 thiamine pyrophosphokinase [Belliella kenyensis]